MGGYKMIYPVDPKIDLFNTDETLTQNEGSFADIIIEEDLKDENFSPVQ